MVPYRICHCLLLLFGSILSAQHESRSVKAVLRTLLGMGFLQVEAFSPSKYRSAHYQIYSHSTDPFIILDVNYQEGTRCQMNSNPNFEGEPPRPIPEMPSEMFQQLALSQLELLAASLPQQQTDIEGKIESKIKSMALYLPQENARTGQLEFLPAVIYPHPSSERVFIASDADSGSAPTLPKLLTKLPGFAAPGSLLPRYPMVSAASSSSGGPDEIAGVGVIEEVLCDVRSGAAALSLPLFSGSQTVGVLLVSPAVPEKSTNKSNGKSSSSNGKSGSVWTVEDRDQIARAARTLSMALSMDMERSGLVIQNERIQSALSDSLHQVKNPLQALRTFGKLLQRRVASTGVGESQNNQVEVGTTFQLLELAQNLMEQSDRVLNLLAPMDSIVDSLDNGKKSGSQKAATFYLKPAPPSESQSLVPRGPSNPPLLPWETETLDFARRKMTQQSAMTNSSTPKIGRRKESGRPAARSIKEKTSNTNNTSTYQGRTQPLKTKPAQRNATMESERKNEAASPPSRATTNSQPSQPASKAKTSLVGVDDDLAMGFVLDVLQPIFAAFQAIAEERGISFQVFGMDEADELPGVMMRRKALQEAVSNLLDNAFKYVELAPVAGSGSPRASKNESPLVRVRLVANDSQSPAGVTILVEDNGPGICQQEAEAVFERGFRSPATNSLVSGTGIGLDISRCLLESMCGTLECLVKQEVKTADFYPEPLEGAVFRLVLFRGKR